MTSNKQLHDLIDQVASGALDPAIAKERLLERAARPAVRRSWFRSRRSPSRRASGIPGSHPRPGQNPAQIAAIAAEIVARGSTLLVTRAGDAAYDAVRAKVPNAVVPSPTPASSRSASKT